MMYRRKRPSELTEELRQDKLVKDKEYEQAVANLSTPFYQKKRSVGVTPEEQTTYEQVKHQLWSDYEQWAIASGLCEEITLVEQELAQMDGLLEQIHRLNNLRTQLGKKELELTEKVEKAGEK